MIPIECLLAVSAVMLFAGIYGFFKLLLSWFSNVSNNSQEIIVSINPLGIRLFLIANF